MLTSRTTVLNPYNINSNLSVKPNPVHSTQTPSQTKELAIVNSKFSKLGKTIGKVINENQDVKTNTVLTTLQPITMINAKR